MKYTIIFSKLGYLRFISHLDMIRLFKRAFKRAKINLKFSEGFNPHPKMTFAQPLSLGYMSVCEILDIETKEAYSNEYILQNLEKALPRGINIIECVEREDNYKAIASKISWAKYLVQLPKNQKLEQELKNFLEQDEIISIKKQKKKKTFKEIDIKPLIREYYILDDVMVKDCKFAKEENLNVIFKVDCGSISNLNVDLIFKSFISYLEKDYENLLAMEDIDVTRIEMQ